MPQPQQNRRARSPRALDNSSILGKVQPQAIEVEEAVLGAIMLEKDAFSKVSEILTVETFYERKNQLVFEAIRRLALEQKPIDILTVNQQLIADGTLDEIGGPYYIASLTAKVGSASHIEYHANIIAQKYLQRQLISYAGSIEAAAFDETCDVDETMQKAEAELFQLSQRNIRNGVIQIDPVIQEALLKIEQAANRADGLSGLPTGFHDLDKMTSG